MKLKYSMLTAAEAWADECVTLEWAHCSHLRRIPAFTFDIK